MGDNEARICLTYPWFCCWWCRAQFRASVVVLPLNIFIRFILSSLIISSSKIFSDIFVYTLFLTCHMEEAVVGLGL